MRWMLFAMLCLAVVPSAYGAELTPAESEKLDAATKEILRDKDIRPEYLKFIEARKAHLADRRKYPNDRNPKVSKAYREAEITWNALLRKSLAAKDPQLAVLFDKQNAPAVNEGENKTDAAIPENSAMAKITDDPKLPRVLLIGDSISIGYTVDVRKLLKGKANVHRIPTNGGATDIGLANIDAWLGEGKWDVIHFNFGLHDAKFLSETELRHPRDRYVANLQKLVDRMQKTGAKLIFATTTPTPEVLSPTRRFDKISERNQLAVELMKKEGVAIDDLYAVVIPVEEKIRRPNDLHYIPEGYALLAQAVTASIEAQLAAR
jgi:lysophospholipase L1-like esterase